MNTRNNDIPLYEQIVEILKEEITTNYKAGDQIPTEEELGEKFKVSRGTIRRSIDELTKQNILLTRQGKGTFYIGQLNLNHNINNFCSIVEELENQGHNPKIIELETKVTFANDKITKILGITEDEPIIFKKRLFLSENVKLGFAESYFSYILCSNLLKMKPGENILEYLENEIGLDLAYCTENIGVAKATEEDAELLDIEFDHPLFDLWKTMYLGSGVPVAVTRTVLNPRSYRISMVLQRRK